MAIRIDIDGATRWEETWAIAPRQTVIGCSIDASLPPGKAADEAPTCHFTYHTIFGLYTVNGPHEKTLQDADPRASPEGSAKGAWHTKAPLDIPRFYPVQVRIEVRPQFGHSQYHKLTLIPMGSAIAAVALLFLSLCVAFWLLAKQLPAPRLTLLQAMIGVLGSAFLAVATYVAKVGAETLATQTLPMFGLVLVQRSVLVCTLGFAALFGFLNSYVVVIENETETDLDFDFPWRLAGQERVSSGTSISVVPDDAARLRKNPLAFLGGRHRGKRFCVVEPDGWRPSENACRPEPERDDGHSELAEWLSPPHVRVRCGGRWSRLDGRNVASQDDKDVQIDGETVWLTDACGELDAPPTLWYRTSTADDAVHHVRYPWAPTDLDDEQKLWVATADDGLSDETGVTIVSTRQEAQSQIDGRRLGSAPAPEGGPAPTPIEQFSEFGTRIVAALRSEGDGAALLETRITVASGSRRYRRGWPVAGLADGSELELVLRVGDVAPEVTDPILQGAELQCRRQQGRTTSFRATRLGFQGRPGWLTRFHRSPTGITGESIWRLTGGSSPGVTSPWICDAFPGHDPALAEPEEFSADTIDIYLDERSDEDTSSQAVVVPAPLMAKHIAIFRPIAGTEEQEQIGHLQCEIEATDSDAIVIGRVVLETPRRDAITQLRIEAHVGRRREVSDWTAAPRVAKEGAARTIWMCWLHDEEHRGGADVDVEIDRELVQAKWEIDRGKLRVPARPEVVCYYDPESGKFSTKRRGNTKDWETLKDFSYYPKARHCGVVKVKKQV